MQIAVHSTQRGQTFTVYITCCQPIFYIGRAVTNEKCLLASNAKWRPVRCNTYPLALTIDRYVWELCLVHTTKTRQDCLLLFSSCRWCEQNWRQVTVNLKLFWPVLQYGDNYWKQYWLVANSVHTTNKTVL